ncbi:CRISPR-associated endonuclease Cas2 [Candidatus Accumulibacter sp. ACC003]|uniref:CRISPR-associated endonuclease Cas2 n=1 Tax=Candidatus Accumulibacter sp. ACC003 TaxID=2823334 RepID=UPI0025BD2091|nr:CRISPR-associated endonuclease Cas2 [Candidatus Accumulibacter sp. ACC003]
MRGAGEFTVICFDIADNRRRRRAVRVLESFAYRAQESVFEGYLDARERLRLKVALATAIKASEDRLAIYVLAPTDRADVVSLGHGLPAEDFQDVLL